jgi:hypothetical protein
LTEFYLSYSNAVKLGSNSKNWCFSSVDVERQKGWIVSAATSLPVVVNEAGDKASRD